MPFLGGYCPFPIRLGGAKPRVQIVTEALNAGRGTAHDVSTDSPAWVEDNAIARAVASVWDYNELLANQFVPRKISALLSRWEKILALPIDPALTLVERRDRIHEVVSRAGVVARYQEVFDRLTSFLEPITFAIEYKAPGDAGVVTSWRGGWYVNATGTTPPTVTLTGAPAADYVFHINMVAGGTVGVATFRWSTDGGLSFSEETTTAATVALGSTGLTAAFSAGTYDVDNQYYATPLVAGFSSTVATITIVATKPSWMSIADYREKTKAAFPLLDNFLPGWVTFDIVLDGPSPGEFILDSEANLDNQRLSAS
jgi:hypothetical protein